MKFFDWFKDKDQPKKIKIEEFKKIAKIYVIPAPSRKLDKILYSGWFGENNDESQLVCLYINDVEVPGRFWYSLEGIIRNGRCSEIITEEHILRYLETGSLY